jgi:hypothetical protein
LSGCGNHGTPHGASRTREGRRGGAFWFDGIDDYVETPSSRSLRLERGLTISLCVYRKPEEAANAGLLEHLLSKGDASAVDYGLQIAPTHAVGAVLRRAEKGKGLLRIPADPCKHKVKLSRWTHVVMTYDGQVARTFVEGRLDKAVVAAGGIGSSDAPLNIGRCGMGQWQYGFTGLIDDLLIWNRALTEVEVLGLWASLKVLPN